MPPTGERPNSSPQHRFLEPPPPLPTDKTSSGNSSRSVAASSESVNPATSPSAAASGSGPAQVTHSRPIDLTDDDDYEHSAKRHKRCTSDVWQYFIKKDEFVVVDGKQYKEVWGYCNFPKCKAKYRGESTRGTTGFWTHLRSAHSVVKGQQQLAVGKDHEKNINYVAPYRYDPEVSTRKFYLAIVMHEYPFNIVEHEYLVDFIKSLRPSFPIKSRITVRKEIMDIYLEEKNKLYEYLKTFKCRFSTTMDMWTSNQNKGYMCVTVHWIDDDWHIQKRIVNFFHVEDRHTGEKLFVSFTECMVRWNLEKKLFSLTLDNASANEVAVKDIIDDLKTNASVSLVCDGVFFHVRCANHILNLVARDGLSVISRTIENVRALVLAVKGSPLQWEELMKRATECGLQTNKGILLDVATRWNSTFLMLRDALYYKAAFVRLKFADRRRYEHISPSQDEWNKATTLFHALKKFYDLTELLSGTLYPTANLFYKGFCEIRSLLADWSVGQDATIREMAIHMSKKFEKYWDKSNTALAVASFLDPRYKRKLVEFYMRKFYGDVLYQAKLDQFVSVLKQMYQFYATLAPAKNKAPEVEHSKTKPCDLFMDTEDEELESFLYESYSSELDCSNDMDKYMAEPLFKHSGQFDILAWWKNQGKEYPILLQMARDVLAIQVSTVTSESAFSAGGRVVDPYRSRLDPEMVQALICTKDWVAAARKDAKSVASIVGDLEVLEAITDKLIIEDQDIESDPDVMNEAGEL